MNKVRFVAALLMVAPLLSDCRDAAAGATRKQVEEIVEKLRANADLWSMDQEIDVAAEIGLKNVVFDKGSVPHLADVLSKTEIDANGLYVANRLLRQLSFAKTDAIRAALPAVKDLHAKARKAYKAFPRLSDRQVKALKQPSENTAKARVAMAERRRRKLAAEKPIARHNQMVYTLEKRTFDLMLLAKDPEEDEVLTDRLVAAERERSAIFLTLISAFAADARKMLLKKAGQERAEGIFTALRPHGIRLKMEQKRAYVHRGRPVLREDDNSTHERILEYPGLKLLGMLNRIATPARMPALKLPKAKDVEKYHSKRKKRSRR